MKSGLLRLMKRSSSTDSSDLDIVPTVNRSPSRDLSYSYSDLVSLSSSSSESDSCQGKEESKEETCNPENTEKGSFELAECPICFKDGKTFYVCKNCGNSA